MKNLAPVSGEISIRLYFDTLVSWISIAIPLNNSCGKFRFLLFRLVKNYQIPGIFGDKLKEILKATTRIRNVKRLNSREKIINLEIFKKI